MTTSSPFGDGNMPYEEAKVRFLKHSKTKRSNIDLPGGGQPGG
jgi:hypothetical protein